MVDFNELRKPEVRERLRKQREADEAKQAAKDRANRFMWEKLMPMIDDIDNEWERDFLRSLSYRFNIGLPLTGKQEAKLAQIFERW